MKTFLDCHPCFLRQALSAARLAGADERGQKAVLDQILETPRRVELSSTPPEIGDRVHHIVRKEVGSRDPCRAAKANSTQQALALYPRLKAMLAQPFAADDGATFRDALSRAGKVLYLADNAGETVFDRLLIKTLDALVLYAVKTGPILNDATRDDALAAGVDRVADIVTTGSDALGTILGRCSQEFRRLYDTMELVIAKGQANYETLSDRGPKVFFCSRPSARSSPAKWAFRSGASYSGKDEPRQSVEAIDPPRRWTLAGVAGHGTEMHRLQGTGLS